MKIGKYIFDGKEIRRTTNADRIRAMTDEELAEYIWQLQNTKERRSTNGWFDWLKEEVDDATD